jgi:hypothetical protein
MTTSEPLHAPERTGGWMRPTQEPHPRKAGPALAGLGGFGPGLEILVQLLKSRL